MPKYTTHKDTPTGKAQSQERRNRHNAKRQASATYGDTDTAKKSLETLARSIGAVVR